VPDTVLKTGRGQQTAGESKLTATAAAVQVVNIVVPYAVYP
jgi:hypothetical protein